MKTVAAWCHVISRWRCSVTIIITMGESCGIDIVGGI